ncbi:hypothetical protein [Moritella viscosa]|uniref:hypothetical protein n=1 Tax=Moritella viscosa TaxID=80854 RepID=UPI00091DC7F6|nr:hypothetical protein [Moritella viscosa]SGZ02123.1 Glucose-6-phosphate 1-dehydrogenase [Moritella viscosa]
MDIKVLPEIDWENEPEKLIRYLLTTISSDEPILIIGIENAVLALEATSNQFGEDVACVHYDTPTKELGFIIEQWQSGNKRILLTIRQPLTNPCRFAAAKHVVIGKNEYSEESMNLIFDGFSHCYIWAAHQLGATDNNDSINNKYKMIDRNEMHDKKLDLTHYYLRVVKLSQDLLPISTNSAYLPAVNEHRLIVKSSELNLKMNFTRPVFGSNKLTVANSTFENADVDGLYLVKNELFQNLRLHVINKKINENYHLFYFRSNPSENRIAKEYLFSSTAKIKRRAELILRAITVSNSPFAANHAGCRTILNVEPTELIQLRKMILNIYNMPLDRINTSGIAEYDIQFEDHIRNYISDFVKKYKLDCAQLWAEDLVRITVF